MCLRSCSYSGINGRMIDVEKTTVSINVRSFRGAVVVLKVSKQAGMEDVSLLAEDEKPDMPDAQVPEESSNLWNTLSRYLPDASREIQTLYGPNPI